jgi:16S rRNA (uracil1498-N3)-methyltransferase
MTRRRWIADEIAGDRALLTGDQAGHLMRVLRVRVGQEFEIASGNRVRRGRVTSVEEGRVEFRLGEDVASATLPEVTVLLSIFKFDRMEWAIEKLTELGVTRIIPVVARRTEAHLAKAADKRVQRWRRIAREAAQQSRRTAPPEVASPVGLKEVLAVEAAARVVLSEGEQALSFKQALGGVPVALAFGPEGGWTPEELEAFAAAGWKSASLGTTILRAETAAIVAVAVAMAELQT